MTHIELQRGSVSTWPEEIEEDRDGTDCGVDNVADSGVGGCTGDREGDRPEFWGVVLSNLPLLLVALFVVVALCINGATLLETETDHYGTEERYHAQAGHGMAREAIR